jgi:dTDP-4-dehydrorhamnose 3,5-epimerase
MPFLFKPTTLEGVIEIHQEKRFEDFRGEFVETYNEKEFSDAGYDVKFVQDDISVSYKNVFRGLHGDNKTTKLLSCLHGRIYFIVANCNSNSDNFGKWQAFNLSDKNRIMVLVPPLYGIGYLALSDVVVYHYKQNQYYSGADNQFTYHLKDLGISLPIDNAILSERDKG